MIIELTARYAQAVLRALKEREEALEIDLDSFEGEGEIMQELASIRTVKDFIEKHLLEE